MMMMTTETTIYKWVNKKVARKSAPREDTEPPSSKSDTRARTRRLFRSVVRKQKGSANRRKARRKLARHYVRIANIRADALHKLTTDLTRRFELIGIEDLNVKGMLSNRHFFRWVSDMGFFEFRRQLNYKARDAFTS